MPDNTSHTALFNRLLEGKLSGNDMDELIQWLGSGKLDPEAATLILQQLRQDGMAQQVDPAIIERLEARLPLIFAKDRKVVSIFKQKWLQYAAAAALIIAFGLYFLVANKPTQSVIAGKVTKPATKNEILPGKEGAILTLVDGSKLVIDSMGNGLLTTQHGTRVSLKNGQLVYDAATSPALAVGYNTMTTPKGRQFQLVLPDGSKVWLNAASSIRYPIMFTGKERKVEITGEAYFEVAHNKSLPFRVQVNSETTIEVLGTHFNINSYTNEESINTTLLEGSVRVLSSTGKTVLKPGQQAQTRTQEKTTVLDHVDVEKVMAWKNGVFNFDDATLEEVMRQLERWYDIEVVYEKNIPKLEFLGKMGKDLSLAAVLSGLEKSNVHFRLEQGRKLVVLP